MGAEMNVIQIHLAVDQYIAAVKRVHQEEPSAIEVIDFYGLDETLAHLSFACAEMLSAQTRATRSVALAECLAVLPRFDAPGSNSSPDRKVVPERQKRTSFLASALGRFLEDGCSRA
jgi:hypothetical protein